jgi:hypothetical protein
MARAKARKSTDIVPMMVRMREGLRKKLERTAEDNAHSINAEINLRLELSFALAEQEKRDTAIVDMIAGPSTASQGLLRLIIAVLQRHPRWADSQSSADQLADTIGEWVRNPSKYLADYVFLENLAKEDEK